MAGLLTPIFDSAESAQLEGSLVPDLGLGGDGDQGGGGAAGDTASSDAGPTSTGGEGGSSSMTTGGNALEGHVSLNPTISLDTELSGSYETLDGTTHSWSNEQDLSLTANVDAVLGLSNDYMTGIYEG